MYVCKASALKRRLRVIAAARKEAMKTEPFLSRTPVYRKYTGDLVPL